VKDCDPVARVRYDDGLTQEFPLERLRLADLLAATLVLTCRRGGCAGPGGAAAAGSEPRCAHSRAAGVMLRSVPEAVGEQVDEPYRLGTRGGLAVE